MSKQSHEVDYGNWVSKKFIYIPGIIAVIFLGVSYLSFQVYGEGTDTCLFAIKREHLS